MRLCPNPNPWWGYPGAQNQSPSLECLLGHDAGDGKKHSSILPERHPILGSQAENPDWMNIQWNPKRTPPIREHPRHTTRQPNSVLLPASHTRFESRGTSLRVCRSGWPSPRPKLLPEFRSEEFDLCTWSHMPSRIVPPEPQRITRTALENKLCPTLLAKPSRLGENYKAPEPTPMS